MVQEFIEKIIVHAPDKSSGRRIQQIDIRYHFIGEMEFSAEYATRTAAWRRSVMLLHREW